MPLILEGIVTTLNRDGSPNVSPMGPIVDEAVSRLTFRPFQTSQTYENLKRGGQGAFHVVDDVLLIARAVTGRLETPATFPAKAIDGAVLADCCRWFEFEVTSLDDSQERTTIETQIVHRGHNREFFGFNRAKHAVLEAAILVTRLFLLDRDEVRCEFRKFAVIVDKTGGAAEREAFTVLEHYLAGYDTDDTTTGSRAVTND